MIRVACVSDIHAPKNFEIFKSSVKKLSDNQNHTFWNGFLNQNKSFQILQNAAFQDNYKDPKNI